MKRALFFSLVFMSSSLLAAEKWSCDSSYWPKPGAINGGMYRGTIAADCTITAQTGKGLGQLQKAQVQRIQDDATIVHSGPTDDTFDDMDSKYLDITTVFESSIGKLTTRSDVQVATDKETKLVLWMESTKMSGTGIAGYGRFAGGELIVTPAKGKEYDVTVEITTHVKKPAFVTKRYLINKMRTTLESELVKAEKSYLPFFADNL